MAQQFLKGNALIHLQEVWIWAFISIRRVGELWCIEVVQLLIYIYSKYIFSCWQFSLLLNCNLQTIPYIITVLTFCIALGNCWMSHPLRRTIVPYWARNCMSHYRGLPLPPTNPHHSYYWLGTVLRWYCFHPWRQIHYHLSKYYSVHKIDQSVINLRL